MALNNLFNMDGWLNLLGSIGGGKDRVSNTKPVFRTKFDQVTLEAIYCNNGIGKRVIDLPAYEMTREWIDVENDTENHTEEAFKRIKAKQAFRDLIKWGDLFGGSVMVIGVDDGGLLETPVNMKGIRRIEFLRVYDRYQVSWTSADVNSDPESIYFGEPEFYTIQPYTTGTQFKVHASRIIKYEGVDIPERSKTQNNGWGDSVYQSVYEELREFGSVKGACANIVQDFVQTILQITNLTDLIGTEDGESIVKKRLDIIDMSRTINNTILLDGEEDFSKSASTVTGLPELFQQFALALSAVTGIPLTKLFGQAPAGLNATGESDIRNFYDHIKSRQEDCLLEHIERLNTLVMLSRDDGYKGKIDDEVKITFKPLWQMTDMQEAEWKKVVAETDEIYLRNSVLSPEEVTLNRFEGGYSADTQVILEDRPIEPDPDEPEEKDKQ